MKKIIYLAVSALLSFSSCSDFLDKKPLDSLTEDAVFNDDALLTAYVTVLIRTALMKQCHPQLQMNHILVMEMVVLIL